MSRRTRQKDAIMRVLVNTTLHPNAEWVYEQVRHEISNISLGTVYRNLKLLTRAGKIQQLDIAGSLSRFDGNSQNHYHFMCEQCGRVFDIDEPIDAEIDERVAHKTSFLVRYHRLEFHGLCLDCQTNSIAKEV